MTPKRKWHVEANDCFMAVGGQTIKALPPGLYRAWQPETMFGPGPLYVQKTKIKTDTLYKLDESAASIGIADIQKFWASREQYTNLGALYKRSILLEGPPGTGKTAALNQICDFIVEKRGICLLVDAYEWTVAVQGITLLREIQPSTPLAMVAEDIDVICREGQIENVLSFLEGRTSIDDFVFVGTTNYINNLDRRLVDRPGRLDRIVHVGTPTEATRLSYLQQFTQKTPQTDETLKRWASATDGLLISHLKEFVLSVTVQGDSEESTVARLKPMVGQPTAPTKIRTVNLGHGIQLSVPQ